MKKKFISLLLVLGLFGSAANAQTVFDQSLTGPPVQQQEQLGIVVEPEEAGQEPDAGEEEDAAEEPEADTSMLEGEIPPAAAATETPLTNTDTVINEEEPETPPSSQTEPSIAPEQTEPSSVPDQVPLPVPETDTIAEPEMLSTFALKNNGMFDRYLCPLNDARGKFKTVVLNDKIYAIGGVGNQGNVETIEEYDYRNDSWNTIAQLPHSMKYCAAAGYGNTLYISGGYDNGFSNEFYSYDLLTGEWKQLASMQKPRERHALVYADGLLYALGGRNETGILKTVETYNFSTNSWSLSKEMSTARMDLGVVSRDKTIYVIGGFNEQHPYGYLPSCESFDIGTKRWSAMAPMGDATGIFAQPLVVLYGNRIHAFWRTMNGISYLYEQIYNLDSNEWSNARAVLFDTYYAQAAPLEDGICIIGGYIDGDYCGDVDFLYEDYFAPPEISLDQGIIKFETVNINGETYLIGGRKKGRASSDIFHYNGETAKWETVATLPSARRGFSAVALGNEIYIIGGYYSGDYVREVISYNVETKQWSTHQDIPIARDKAAAAVIGNNIYVAGGREDADITNEVYVYDTLLDTWSMVHEAPRKGISFNLEVYQNKLYLMGGMDETQPLTYIDEYDPATDTWTTKSDDFPAYAFSKTVVFGDKIIIAGQNALDGSQNVIFKEYYPVENYISDSLIDTEFKNAWYGFEENGEQLWLIGGFDGTSYSSELQTIYSEGINNTYNTASIDCRQNNTYKIHFYVSGLDTFKNKTFVVKYKPDELSLEDLCTFNGNTDTQVNHDYIPNTDIFVKEYLPSEGIIKFTIERTIPSKLRWYGDLNVMKFKSSITGTSNVYFYTE